MGIVFRADEPKLNREVALKVMLPEAASDARALARFQREACAQAQVRNEHVTVVFAVTTVPVSETRISTSFSPCG